MSNHVPREEEDFDDWLEDGLRKELAPMAMRPVPAPTYRIRAAGGRRRGLSIFTGTSAALGAKAATGFFVTAFAVAATGAAVTHSPNPVRWGEHVQNAVSDCRADFADGQRGFSDCVSSVAGQVQPQGPAPVVDEHSTPVPPVKSVTAPRVEQVQTQQAPKTPEPQKQVKTPLKQDARDAKPSTGRPTPTPTPREEDREQRGAGG